MGSVKIFIILKINEFPEIYNLQNYQNLKKSEILNSSSIRYSTLLGILPILIFSLRLKLISELSRS